MDIEVGQKAGTEDNMHGEVVSFQNGVVGIKLKDGRIIYRYLKQIVKLY